MARGGFGGACAFCNRWVLIQATRPAQQGAMEQLTGSVADGRGWVGAGVFRLLHLAGGKDEKDDAVTGYSG